LPDILTEAEKEQAITWAIDQEKRNYQFKMHDKGLHPQDVLTRIAGIDWRERINPAEVLEQANQRKHWAQESKESREREQKEREEARNQLLKQWDANKFYNCMKRHFIEKHGQFFVSPTNELYVKALCFFLSNDPRFETELGFSFSKGLLIQGTAGLGKTETIKAVASNPLWPIRIHSLLEIADAVRETGECNLNTQRMILLDDVGTEPEVINHYGTKINWFKDFIESYYLHNRTFSGLLITTNLGGDEMEQRYGYRVRSRVREMFNLIQLTGKDLRK